MGATATVFAPFKLPSVFCGIETQQKDLLAKVDFVQQYTYRQMYSTVYVLYCTARRMYHTVDINLEVVFKATARLNRKSNCE